MGFFGNKDIIPDDIAEKIAQKLFERLNLNLDREVTIHGDALCCGFVIRHPLPIKPLGIK